nr:zinc finger protein 184-like [Aedes albopictus]
MRCIVPSCRYDFHKRRRSKHSFPRNLAQRNIWIKAIAFAEKCKLDPSIDFLKARVCSHHFTSDCFKPDKQKNILKKSAIPTRFGAVTVDPAHLSALYVPEPDETETPAWYRKSAKESQIKTKQLVEDALLCVRNNEENTDAANQEIFNLKKYPHVCRLCLQPNSRCVVMVALSTIDSAFGGKSIADFIATITSPEVIFSQNKQAYLPRSVCLQCLEQLKFFAKYRSKTTTAHMLMSSLIELKHGNSGPMLDLFNSQSNVVRALIQDLDLCNLNDYCADDLVDEFPSYDLASFEGFSGEEDKMVQELQQCEVLEPELLTLPIKTEMMFDEEIIADDIDEFNSNIKHEEESVVMDEYLQSKKPKPKYTEKTFDTAGDNHELNSDIEHQEESVPTDMDPQTKKPSRPKYTGKTFDEPLQCTKCPFSTHFQAPFRAHEKVHEKRESCKSYACKAPGCSEVFNNWDDFRRHGPVAHKRFICDICGLKCSAKRALKDHMARHQGKQEHICSYCQRGHNTDTDLRKHIQIMHLRVANYLCDTCGVAFRKKANRDEHQLGHSDVYGFPCQQCDKKFKKKPQLTKHINLVHEKVRVPCPHCNHEFQTFYLLSNHIELVHGIQTLFVCDICVSTFRSQDALDSHRARHDNPHELECARCLILFKTRELLDDHLCISYRDDYICCGKDLRYHAMYNRHMLMKHDTKTNVRVKPIPGQLVAKMRAQRKRIERCPKCEQTFATRALKKQHMETCSMGGEERIDDDDGGSGDVNF